MGGVTLTPDIIDTALLGVDAPEEEVYRHHSLPVDGLRALWCTGISWSREVEQLGNCWNVDIGATFPGRNRLTLLQINRSLHAAVDVSRPGACGRLTLHDWR